MRHTRQARLAEVGDARQARLSETAIAVRGTAAAGAIEARYLAGAGVGVLHVQSEEQARAARSVDARVQIVRAIDAGEGAPRDDSPLRDLAIDPAAREVALGAWRALDSLRRALGVALAADGGRT
jgi:hypothetical protein